MLSWLSFADTVGIKDAHAVSLVLGAVGEERQIVGWKRHKSTTTASGPLGKPHSHVI